MDSTPTSEIQQKVSSNSSKKALVPVVIVFLLIIILIILIIILQSKKTQTNQLQQDTSLSTEHIPTPPVKSGDFVSVVKWEKTLPESLRKKRPQTKMTIDGVNYIREYAVVQEILKERASYRLILSASNQEITAFVDDKTLIAKAFYGYDSNGTLRNIQYYGLGTKGLAKVKIGDIIYIAHPESNNTQLREFVFVE